MRIFSEDKISHQNEIDNPFALQHLLMTVSRVLLWATGQSPEELEREKFHTVHHFVLTGCEVNFQLGKTREKCMKFQLALNIIKPPLLLCHSVTCWDKPSLCFPRPMEVP